MPSGIGVSFISSCNWASGGMYVLSSPALLNPILTSENTHDLQSCRTLHDLHHRIHPYQHRSPSSLGGLCLYTHTQTTQGDSKDRKVRDSNFTVTLHFRCCALQFPFSSYIYFWYSSNLSSPWIIYPFVNLCTTVTYNTVSYPKSSLNHL